VCDVRGCPSPQPAPAQARRGSAPAPGRPLEDLPRGRAFDRQARTHPSQAHARQQGDVIAPQLRGTLASARSPRLDQAYRGASEVFVPISSTNHQPLRLQTPGHQRARQAALSHSSLSLAPTDLFFGSNPHAPEHPGNRGVAHRNSTYYAPQELAPLGQGRLRMILQIRLQELSRAFVELRFGAGTLLRGEGPPLAIGCHISLDRGEMPTPKVRAASIFGIPLSTASTIFLRRSSE
jgi:hypothetical protein